MKTSIILLSVLAAGIAGAQPPSPTPIDHTMETALAARANMNLYVAQPEKPNEIAGRKVTYSGVAVQVVKCKEPWQLLNPCAPAEYGTGHENLNRDIITHKVVGFKIFSLNF